MKICELSDKSEPKKTNIKIWYVVYAFHKKDDRFTIWQKGPLLCHATIHENYLKRFKYMTDAHQLIKKQQLRTLIAILHDVLFIQPRFHCIWFSWRNWIKLHRANSWRFLLHDLNWKKDLTIPIASNHQRKRFISNTETMT